ncbi:MAG: acetolactate synthase small subunit [Clostridia bacterium]|nr:acetolactate synthase small subunit [Clostridia bacterium]MDR3645857.1 acetolactate synthase small subunit [Clostridia bacterium]
MKHTISVLVENHAGVLSKVSGLFARRAFNIDSLAVGVTEDPAVSRMTIVVNGDDYTVEQVEKQLNKLIDVIKVKVLSSGEFISEELILIKVNAPAQSRSEIMQIADIFGAKIIDVSRSMLTLEFAGDSARIHTLEDMLTPYGIREEVRTGTIAIESGTGLIRSADNRAAQAHSIDN